MKASETTEIRELIAKVSSWNPAASKDEDTFTYIDLSAIDQDRKVINGARDIPCAEAPSRARQIVQAGDILVSTVRPNLNGVAVVPDELHGATASTGFCVLRPREELLDGRYLFHWVKGAAFIQDMVKKAIGASYPAVSDRIVQSSTLPLPPIEEQRRIAAILDKADELRAKRKEALALLDNMAQSFFIEMFGDPATNPKKFPSRKLGDIIKFEGGAQPPASTFSDSDGPDKIRLVQIRDFKTDKFKTYIPKTLSKRFFFEDDVMIGRYGPPVFQIFRGLSGSYNVALMKAAPKEGVTKEFLFHLLNEKRLHDFVVANSERTAGQSGVNLSLLENYDAYLPPMSLQIDFSERMRVVEYLRKKGVENLEQASSLLHALQANYFHGTV